MSNFNEIRLGNILNERLKTNSITVPAKPQVVYRKKKQNKYEFNATHQTKC